MLAEGLFKYVMMLPPAYEKAINSEDFDRYKMHYINDFSLWPFD